MAWTPYHTALRGVLAALFPDREDVRSLLDDAGVPVANVALGHRPLSNWHEVLREADNRGKLPALVAAAFARYPDNPALALLRGGELPAEPPEVIDWRARGAVEPDLEKITGLRSTLLPICFLERGVTAARSVARVRLPKGAGSGFLIATDLLATNHHVLPDEGVARAASVNFNYQTTVEGTDAVADTFALAPEDGFVTSTDDDWTVVRVKPKDGRTAGEAWGHVELTAAAVCVDDPVNIIQHPGGGHKQVALYHNHVAFVNDRLQYLTDTEPGSSGSPVFNDSWQCPWPS
jgi:hypothetical protein